MYYILLPEGLDRDRFLSDLRARMVQAVFHSVPLHSAPAGMRLGRTVGNMQQTNMVSDRLNRLPMWVGLSADLQDRVVAALDAALPRES
jgi:dTDP-4-amino-4,6-dideoxygalactose transaminase